MAEIRIEPKRRGLGWLWLLLALIIVAALAWYFLYPGRTPPPATGAAPATGALESEPQPRAAVIAAVTTRHGSLHATGGSYGKEG
jgi:hypothetical protein